MESIEDINMKIKSIEDEISETKDEISEIKKKIEDLGLYFNCNILEEYYLLSY